MSNFIVIYLFTSLFFNKLMLRIMLGVKVTVPPLRENERRRTGREQLPAGHSPRGAPSLCPGQ